MIEHPDLHFTPRLSWGEPIPLIWQQVCEGLWRIWPPKQFLMSSPAEDILWELGDGSFDGSFYRTNSEINSIPPGTNNGVEFGHNAPVIDWGGALPCLWSRYDQGHFSVQIGSMKVRCGSGFLFFGHHSRVANFLYPRYLDNIELQSGVFGSAEFMGSEVNNNLTPQGWRRRVDGNRWCMGSLFIDPPLIKFTDSNELLPLDFFSDAEIEQERLSYLPDYALERGDIHYLSMVVDLSKHLEFMHRVGDDVFSAQVQCFLSENDLERISDGALVHIGSDRNYGSILSILRRYGENYMMYDNNWAEKDPELQAVIEGFFRESGYSIKVYPPYVEKFSLDEIWDTMPSEIKKISLKRKFFGRAKYPNPLVLAVLMGHFWDEESGWNFKEGDLTEEVFNTLQGGHLPKAFDISALVKARG